MRKLFRWSVALLLLCIIVSLGVFYKELKALKRKNKLHNRFFARIETAFLGSVSLPEALQDVPFADDEGLVLNTATISVRGVQAPWNASILKEGDGYLIFFRYDVVESTRPRLVHTHIGYAYLDANFQQTAQEFVAIDTGSQFSEDPRAIRVDGVIYLVFNDLQICNGVRCRTMRIGPVNFETSKLDFVTNLDLQMSRMEKNWAAFEYIENGKPSIYLEYYISPHKILKLPDPSLNELVHITAPAEAVHRYFHWPHIWGELRGGATPQKVGDQYLSFCHSCFADSFGNTWYVMGAYTFEDKPPFRINGLSNYPILFKHLYETPPTHTALPDRQVIFPGGFLTEVRDGKEVIHLVCGENDCAIRVVTLDKEALLKSLRRF